MDGQNLYHAARERFGYHYPNYDVEALARELSAVRRWALSEVRFYTGIPDAARNPRWHRFWMHKLSAMRRRGIVVVGRPLRYRSMTVPFPDGTRRTVSMAEEKGIDFRIALDVIALAHRRAYDVALVLSQDQDLAEVAREIRVIAREQHRWIKIASAYPVTPAGPEQRGINGTDWIAIDRALYDRCLDRRDYRLR